MGGRCHFHQSHKILKRGRFMITVRQTPLRLPTMRPDKTSSPLEFLQDTDIAVTKPNCHLDKNQPRSSASGQPSPPENRKLHAFRHQGGMRENRRLYRRGYERRFVCSAGDLAGCREGALPSPRAVPRTYPFSTAALNLSPSSSTVTICSTTQRHEMSFLRFCQ